MKIINLLHGKNGNQYLNGVMLSAGHCIINDCRYVLTALDKPDYVVKGDECVSVKYRWVLQTEADWHKEIYG